MTEPEQDGLAPDAPSSGPWPASDSSGPWPSSPSRAPPKRCKQRAKKAKANHGCRQQCPPPRAAGAVNLSFTPGGLDAAIHESAAVAAAGGPGGSGATSSLSRRRPAGDHYQRRGQDPAVAKRALAGTPVWREPSVLAALGPTVLRGMGACACACKRAAFSFVFVLPFARLGLCCTALPLWSPAQGLLPQHHSRRLGRRESLLLGAQQPAAVPLAPKRLRGGPC